MTETPIYAAVVAELDVNPARIREAQQARAEAWRRRLASDTAGSLLPDATPRVRVSARKRPRKR